MTKKIAVIVGVSAPEGLGASLCWRAAKDGYAVVAAGRTKENLDRLSKDIEADGGIAHGIVADITSESQVLELFQAIDDMDGKLDLVVYNVGNAFWHESLTMTADFFEEAWRACCFGGFLVGKEAGIRLKAAGSGTLLFTGATASLKSRGPFMAFASAKAGLRAVAAALARELGPSNVHVGHVIVDGMINGERANSRMPDMKQKLGVNGMLEPDAIAECYWQMHLQHPSCWTFECDVRPFKENF